MKKWLTDIFYSFPIQLVILQLRNNLFLIAIWFLIALLMTGMLGNIFGIKFLFLTPEYLGKVNFWSFFFLGLAFGGFFMTWNLTTYLLDSHHFPFLATLERPFTKFCLNNLLIPLTFSIIYFGYTIYFQSYHEYWAASVIFGHILGFLTGVGILVVISAIYFHYTNKDILSFLKIRNQMPPNLMKGAAAPGRKDTVHELIGKRHNHWRVDTYLTEDFRPRIVRSVAHYDSSILLSVFRQNHVNALIVQLFGMVVLIILGFLIDNPYFRIPAAASVFILASVLVALMGAITYWFNRWRILVFLLLLILINYLTSYDIFNHKNKGYGLDYTTPPAKYSYPVLEEMADADLVDRDKENTIAILENWKAKFADQTSKPKMVIFCASGGGMRAAVWTMQVMQQADSLLNGKLMEHTSLITGASGGLIGTAYIRELYLQKQLGLRASIYSPAYINNISSDLLNSLAFTIVSNDLFLPWIKFESGGFTYRKDRGYIFEQQLNENTSNAFKKTIADYKKPEQQALVPMMFITPSIVNDGRRLIISPQGVSYMTLAPIGVERKNTVEIDAVDFGHLFEQQGAENLLFTSALRMNATYPYILPNVYLPSRPSLEVMDAGFRDNYGLMSATRFIHVFKDWILENTDGVVLVQASGQIKIEDINPNEGKGMIETIFNPLGIAGQIMTLQDYEHDANLGYIFDLLGQDKFDIIRFIYNASKDNERASMTFHLTQREKDDILNSFYMEDNQKNMDRLAQALGRNLEQVLQ
ncbi:MAG: patatin-like phospholipase family protein [Bacteroidota bacterium]